MNTSISDINYSLTDGKYSALNSKLYLIDSFDIRPDDGASAQSTTYDSSREANEGTPGAHGAEEQFAEHQEGIQPNAIANNNAVVDPGQSDGVTAEASDSNPTSNHINAITSSTPVMGINEEAIQNMAMALGEAAAASSLGSGASGNPGSGGQNMSSSSANQTNVSNSTNNTTIEGHEGSTTINNTYNNNTTTYNQNIYNFGDGPGGGGIEINITQISNVINNTINNIVYNGDHILTNIIDIDTVINNVLNNNSIDIDIGDLGDVINNTTNVLGDVINNTTNVLGDVLGDTTIILGDVLNNTTNILSSITNDILGDVLGKIDFTLDVDLGLNTDLITQLNIGDLSNTLNLLNDNILKSVVFDLNSDLLNLHLDSATIFNSPLVTNLENQVSDLLNHVDGITSNIPLVGAVDNLLDAITPNLPIDQLTVGLFDHGTIDPSNLLNITNDTIISEDLGSILSFDNNVLDNSLNILNDEGLQINDLLQLNDIPLLDTVNGVTPLDNLGEVVDNLADNVVNDASNLLNDALGGNNSDVLDPIVDNVLDNDGGNILNEVLGDIGNNDGGGNLLDNPVLDPIFDNVLDNNGGNLLNEVLGDNAGSDTNLLDPVSNILNEVTDHDTSGIIDQVVNSLQENTQETTGENNIVDTVVNNVVGDDNPLTNIINQLESSFNNVADNNVSENNLVNDVSNLLNGNDTNAADAIFDTIASTINEVPVSAPEAQVNEVDMGGITNNVTDVLDHHVGGLLDHIGI